MGNKSQESNIKSATIRIINQFQLCHVVASADNHYLVRELSFSSLQALQTCMMHLRVYQNFQNPAVLSLLKMEYSQAAHMCGSQFKLTLHFENSALSIGDQILARAQNQQYFSFGQVTKLIHGCLQALSHIEHQLIQNHLETGILNRLFIKPSRILILEEGLVKVVNPLFVSPYDRYQYHPNTYYSPEKLSDFDFPEDEKCSIFQLGITLLHVITLSSCGEVYNGFQVQQDQIDNKITEVWRIFGHQFLCEILTKMTKVFRPFRSTIEDCLAMAEKLQNMVDKLQVSRFPSQESEFILKASRETIDQFPWHKMPQKKRKITNQILEKENKFQIGNQNEIEQSLFYSPMTMKMTEYKKCNEKRSLWSAHTGQNKESCVITNQKYPFNFANISSQAQVQTGFQSYCYGKQLSEGIIPSQRNPLNQITKFERHRTKFNKNLFKGREMSKNDDQTHEFDTKISPLR